MPIAPPEGNDLLAYISYIEETLTGFTPITSLSKFLADGITHINQRINSKDDNSTLINITPIKLLDPSYCGNLHASEGIGTQTILSIVGDCLKKPIKFEYEGAPVETGKYVNINRFQELLFQAAEAALSKGVGYLILQTESDDDDLSEELIDGYKLINVVATDCEDVRPAEWGSTPGPYYGKVEYYTYSPVVASTDSGWSDTSRIHASRVIPFLGYRLPAKLARSLNQEGISLYQLTLDTMARYKLLDGAAANIATSWLTKVLEMKDVDLKQTNKAAEGKLRARASVFSRALELARVVVIGQGEAFTVTTASANGFSELGSQIRATYCAESGISEAIAFSAQLTGAPPDPDTVWGAYWGKCATRQTMYIAPGACRLLQAFMVSSGQTIDLEKIVASFDPIREVTDKDQAAINQMNAQARAMNAQADNTISGGGTVNVEKVPNINTGLNPDGTLPLHDSIDEPVNPWFFGLGLSAASVAKVKVTYLNELLEHFPDAATPKYFHATIAYGDVEEEKTPYLLNAAVEVAWKSYTVTAGLNKLQVFADNDYATVVLVSDKNCMYNDYELRRLNSRFSSMCEMSSYTKEYVPHVTLARIPMENRSLGTIIHIVTNMQLPEEEVNLEFNEAVVSYNGLNTKWQLGNR